MAGVRVRGELGEWMMIRASGSQWRVRPSLNLTTITCINLAISEDSSLVLWLENSLCLCVCVGVCARE